MPADDWMLTQGTVEFREEERRHGNGWNLIDHPLFADPACPACGGDGWYVDHADECYEAGDCNCSGVQVPCECLSDRRHVASGPESSS